MCITTPFDAIINYTNINNRVVTIYLYFIYIYYKYIIYTLEFIIDSGVYAFAELFGQEL